jgi:LacI family transcriptional regulator
MDDVARRVGVAKSTVSLALNGKPGVSAELRAAIFQAAEELGYSLPQARPPKRATPHRTFAVVYHVVEETEAEPAGVALGYLNGIQAYARQNQISLTVLTSYPGGGVQRFSLQFLDQADPAPEGLIVMGAGLTRESAFIRWAERHAVPVVAVSRNWLDVPISTVSQDHAQQARIALDHLAHLGHTRIGFIARRVDRDCDWFAIRLRCHQEALERAGVALDGSLVSIGEDGGAALKALLARQPDVTAVFAIYDRVAVEALQATTALGLEVPRDLSIIGLDNVESPPAGYPRLTTVGFSHYQAGHSAAKLLAEQIEQPALSYGRIVLRSELIERESCARAPRGERELRAAGAQRPAEPEGGEVGGGNRESVSARP